MRDRVPDVLEKGRVNETGEFFCTFPGEFVGRFVVKCPATGAHLMLVASDGKDWTEAGFPGVPWEHVSVSTRTRCPTWEEMCWVKSLCWGDDECVVEFHPPKADYVNCHPHCLHLWKPVGVELPRPPSICVGPQTTVSGA